ncbi:hypothetical protein [Flaviaesturariibacter amylovorans]|uniref:Uncharacterized protein n=1 Tax=Flaviaesturariibacter amylovorans TaxID=1084520 RepID=A0ABP8GQL9_9BACT
MMVIDNKYEFGQKVYVVTDPDQHARQVTEIQVKPGGGIVYEVSYIAGVSHHYEFELTPEPDPVIKTQ